MDTPPLCHDEVGVHLTPLHLGVYSELFVQVEENRRTRVTYEHEKEYGVSERRVL